MFRAIISPILRSFRLCLQLAPMMLPGGKLDEVEFQFHLIQFTSRQHRPCIIPQTVTHSLELLRMGEIISRNMLS